MSKLPLLVRSASLNGYVDLATSVGLDAMAMLRRVGLPRRCLDDPETLISMELVCRLLETSAEAANVEDFGLRLAKARRLSNLGPVSLVLRQEHTGMDALNTLCSYLRLLNASLLTRIEHADGLVLIREDLLLGSPIAKRQAMELTVGVMFQILKGLLGSSWRPRAAYFTHRPPRNNGPHLNYFGCQVVFNAELNGIVCQCADLKRELTDSDSDGFAAFAKRFLDNAMAQSTGGNTETIRHLIAALLPGGRCTIDRVGQQLGISRRTLHRRLEVENQTFASVLNEVRREFALRQMNESDVPQNEVAQMLGFSSPSAFAHWFKVEFSRTFSRWRQENRQVGVKRT